MRNKLNAIAMFSLFSTSYLPLFILVIFKQLYVNANYLCDIENITFEIIWLKFGISVILFFIALFGIFGGWGTIKNIQKNSHNGYIVDIKNIENKNSETIGYIATYIIPFLYHDFSDIYSIFSFLFILFIIYRIYIHSSLLVINPTISFWYSIYEIEFKPPGQTITQKGLVLSKNRDLHGDTSIKIYSIGNKLFIQSMEG